jgi:hypothetical protein
MIKKYIFLAIFSLSAVIGVRADVMDLRDDAPKGGEAIKVSQEFNAKRRYHPVILLLIREQIKGEIQSKAWWVNESTFSRVETLLEWQFNMFDFRVVEPGQAYGIISKNPVFGRPDISDSQAIDMAKQLGADYVIIGEAVVEGPKSVFEASNNRSYDAELKARLLSVKNSGVRKNIFSSGKSIDPQVSDGMSRALQNAAREAALTALAAIREKQDKAN